MNERLASLRIKHGLLERSIAAELSRPLPEALRIKALKQAKLRAKDEIELLLARRADLKSAPIAGRCGFREVRHAARRS